MRGTIFAILIVAAASLVAGSILTSAQVIDADPCERACYEQERVCVEQCGRHTNPVECEAECHDARIDCLRRCR